MECCKRTPWRLYKLSRSSRLKIVISAMVTLVTVYLFYNYQCRETIAFSRMRDLYTRNLAGSPIVDCEDPSLVIRKPNQYLSVRVTNKKVKRTTVPKQKIVLLWTKYFDSDYANDYCFFLKGNATFTFNKCPVSECSVTNDRSLLRTANVIIFHQPDIDLNDLPEYRNPDQIWAFYNLESPARIRNNWKMMNGLFNWTLSYREDSDIKVKYGQICRLPPSKQQSYKKNYLQDKTKEVAWFVSDCYTSSNREQYAKELSKYINIDIYGTCGTKTCSASNSKYCYEKVLKSYKFYLAFENSICQDYVTEKLFNILNTDIIPVVMGGADYERIAPPNSYINVFNYRNPQKLAEYLRTVGGSDRLYNSYFEWKGKYSINLVPWMCELCEKVHSVGSSTQISNMYQWWYESAQCRTWCKDGNELLAIHKKE